LGNSYDSLSKSVERLSSGLRINSAKDDAAGLAVRELVRADVAMLRQGSRNGQDAISMLQTAEGAMGVINDIMVRMKELAEQAATESYSSEQRSIMNQEFAQLAAEIDRIAGSTKFNNISLLNSSATYSIHVGDNQTNGTVDIVAEHMTTSALGLETETTAAVAEYVVFAAGVADSAGTWFTTGASAGGDTLKVKFGTNDASAQITFDAAGSAYTMQEVRDAINASASSEVTAAIVQGTGSNYYLKVTNATAGLSGTLTVTYTNTSGDTAIYAFDSASSDWTYTAGTSAVAADVSINSVTSAAAALDSLTSGINTKDAYRAKLGYMMNRLEAAVSVVDIQAENLMAAESRISDVDVATEMATMTRNQVLAQAGVAMLAQANMMPQMALQLLS
jgi:flagellin